MISGLLAASGGAAFAQTVTYTFEAPIFTLAAKSPNLNNKAPNMGSGVTANFTSSLNTAGAQIGDNGNGPSNPGGTPGFSSQFSGQFLNSIANDQTITVSLNGATFTSLSLDFYLTDAGMLNFNSSSGSASQVGTLDAATGNTYTGVLNFSSATPFSSFTLATGATTGGRPLSFGIDNLQLSGEASSPTPAPGSALVLGAGLLYPLVGLVKRRRQKAA